VARLIAPRLKARLPAPEPGWHPVTYAILADGSLACLEATFDIKTAWRDYQSKVMAQQSDLRWTDPPAGTRNRIVRFDGTHWAVETMFDQQETFALFDRMSDGNWLVADMRSAAGSPNARLIAPDGNLVRRLTLGDGIEHMQCDGSGSIWIDYFDEGIYGDPARAPGLVQYDEHGRTLLPREENGQRFWPGPSIDSAYALNVAADAVWACTYSDFPIRRIGYDGSTKIWANRKTGASLMAVDGDRVVLLGGYGPIISSKDERRHGVLLQLREHATRLGEFQLDLDVEQLAELSLASGRGSVFHFVHRNGWYQLSLQDVAREFS
jgi:hypothetical protein